MALADYRLCDVCGEKVFYDANLNYNEGGTSAPFRISGEPQYEKPELLAKYGTTLDYLGDWAVICEDCARTHKCVVVPIDFAMQKGEQS
jgi:hypothetical protein